MSQFKRKLSAFTAMLAFVSLSSVSAFAALPTDVIGKTDNMSVTGNNTQLNVDLNGGKGAVGQVDWKDFSVPGGQTVNFGFSGLSQTVINRVLGGHTSEIMGKLTSSCVNNSCSSYEQTSKVILINPAGVVFGAGSAVDLNSFTVSTFDFNGAKNLKGMTDSELSNYQSGVLNKLSPVSVVNGEGRNYGDITFDSNYTSAFDAAGIDKNSYAGKTFINFDGSNLDVNKSFAAISDNIDYKDSILKTGGNYNYITSSNQSTYSNAKLITADGVTFRYIGNGYIDDQKIADDTKTDVVRNMSIDNSGLGASDVAIETGSFMAYNNSAAANSNIKITNSVIKANKMVNTENGDIMIVGTNDINLKNARLETSNSSVTYNGVTKDTLAKKGGEVFIKAGKDVNVEDSLIITDTANTDAVASGKVTIDANNAKIDNSKILARGGAKIKASKDVNIDGSLVRAANNINSDIKRDVEISGAKNVNINNSVVEATKDLKIKSVNSNNATSGNIIVSSDLDSNGKNQTLLIAGDKLSIQGANTTLDNASSVYQQITFYNDGTTGLNNVTVANNSTFTPLTSTGSIADNITLETNGDFTLDNATLKRASYDLTFDRVVPNDETSDLVDDGTPSAINYNFNIKSTANAKNVDVKSTQGNVIAQNNTNVKATQNINLTSDKKNVVINSSDLTAGKDANLTASKGALYVSDNSNVIAGNDLNAIAYETITFGPQGASDVNIDNTTNFTAGNNMLIQSLNGDINGEKTTMPTLTYGDRLTFNAAQSNNFTSEDSLKAVNVDFIAGKSNNFTTKNDIQFVNSSLKSPSNNITTTVDGDVILNNLTINSATANAKDTKTTINAKGNVTTKDVTKSVTADTNATTHKFPQSVEYNQNGTEAPDTILDINQTKLVVNTKVNVTTPQNNTNGSITLDIKNANNKDAGIELTAENNKWDEQIGPNEGPEVRVNAVDNELSISKIITDKLFLDKNDKMHAADVQLTPEQLAGLPAGTQSKGYIEVRDQGGFNLDTDPTYGTTPDGFTYDGNYDSKLVDKDVKTETTRGQTTTDITVTYENEEKVTTTTSTTPVTTTTTTTTTTTEQKHTIDFENSTPDSPQFILVYDKTKVDVETDSKTVNEVITDVQREACEELPELDRTEDDIDSMINQIKLPREQVEVSKTSKVSDNTVDQTSNVMSAAAKVDLGQDSNNENEEEGEE